MKFKASTVVWGGLLALLVTQTAAAQTATVNLSGTKQMIRGFGGMHHPAWQGGPLTSNQMKLAFGTDAGQIGLSILRIPIDENKNNWTNSVGNAKEALSMGAIVFASPWNPPNGNTWRYQENGNWYLNESYYSDYAAHLNSFFDYMSGQGVNLYAVSIQNEPDWGYDWTFWKGTQMVKFLKEQGPSLKFPVMAPESFGFNTQNTGAHPVNYAVINDAAAWAQIDFFGTHMYGTPTGNMSWSDLKQKLGTREMWMTEVYTDSHPDGLPGQPAPPTPAGFADEWPRALKVAKHIHDVLVVGEFQAYVWWYIERDYSFIFKDTETVTKRGWCMAHFSRYVRPGYHRIDVTEKPLAGKDVYVSAFEGEGNVAVVLVNQTDSPQQVEVAIPGTSIETFSRVTTSASKSFQAETALTLSGSKMTVTLDAQSVSTLYGASDEQTDPSDPKACAAAAENAFQGTPIQLPGTLQAEDFDPAGYYDTTAGNEGGAYRTDVDVDIKDLGIGQAVGWMTSGEWLEYTVNVPTAGEYLVTLKTGSVNADRTLDLTVCGQSVGSVTVPQVAEWGDLKDVSMTVTLPAGLQVLRISVGALDYLDLDSVTFDLINADTSNAGATGGATGLGGAGTLGPDPSASGGTLSGGPNPDGRGLNSNTSDQAGCGCRSGGSASGTQSPVLFLVLSGVAAACVRRRKRML